MIDDVENQQLFITPYWVAKDDVYEAFIKRLSERNINYIDYKNFKYSPYDISNLVKFIFHIKSQTIFLWNCHQSII